ncbi:MAG: translation initiation factor eIF-2B subunit delta [Candidatus Marinimicrobia bacterium]|jgi:translation initiation factor 2B subunit (eIF-2B alpha/beta/delta family)|nr:translation initiation factor eIF-2B subunit delta [Candidatus Neomarinimicrobiota bacterium]
MKYYPEFETLLLEQEAGATTLLLKFLNILTRYFTENSDFSREEQVKKIQFFYEKVTEAHPLMAIFPNLYKVIMDTFQKGEQTVPEIVERFRESLNDKIDKTVETASSLIKDGDRVFSFSHSSIVRKSLVRAMQKDITFTVHTTECRPVNEAVNLAKFLARYEIEVMLYTDSAMEKAIETCDLAMVGTDWYWKDGFVNKIGTGLISRLCREKKIPLFVLTDSSKEMSGPPEDWSKDNHPTSLILAESIPNITVFNPYFESVAFTKPGGIIINGDLNRF